MAGELNGTLVLIKDSTTQAIVGQMEATVTYGGTPIDISNKSFQDWITLHDGELSGQQVTVAGSLTYNNDASYEKVKADAFSGTQDTYSIEFGATGEVLSGTFVPTGMSDAAPHGDKVSTSVTFTSSGVVTRTPPV